MRQLRSDLPTFWRLTATRSSGQAVEAFFTAYKTVLNAKARRSNFLENVVNINNLTESYTHEIIDYTIYNFNDSRFTALTTEQKLEFQNAFNYWDATNIMWVPDVRAVEHMTDSIYASSLTLTKNIDYAPINYGEFQFFSDIFAVDSSLPIAEETIYGPVSGTALTCNRTTLYFINAEVTENWFYKRLGFMLGLAENTAPDIVLALYKIRIDGLGYKTLDAYFQACNNIPISRKDEYVVSVSGNTVVTDSSTYTLPVGQEIRVRAGQRVYVGDPFIYSIYMVDSNILPNWWLYDPFQVSSIPSLIYGYVEQDTWALPVTINELTSPFWFGFPNLPMYLMEYFVGGDPLMDTPVFAGTGLDNMLIFPNYIKLLPYLGVDLVVAIDSVVSGAITAFADSVTDPGIKTTATSVGHTLVDGDTISISGGTEYDGNYVVSNVAVNVFDITKTFGATAVAAYEKATFTWSLDGGGTWVAANVGITTQEQQLQDGISIIFKTVDGHVVADQWATHIDANWGSTPGIYVSSYMGYSNLVYYLDPDPNKDFTTMGVEVGDFVYMLYESLGVETVYRATVLAIVDEHNIALSPVVDPATPENGPEQFLTWPPGFAPSVYLKIFKTYNGYMYDSIYQIRFTPLDNVMEVLDKHYVRVFADKSIINETEMVNTWLPLLKPSIPLWTYIEYNYVDNILPYKEALRNEGII